MPHEMKAARLSVLSTLAEDLSTDTHFSREECKCLMIFHERMESIGPLDKSRFRQFLQIVFDITSDVMLDLVFRSFDRDNDNKVNNFEFIKGISIMLRGTLDQLIEFAYFVYDMNGDRSLGREELTHCLKGCMHGGFGVDEDEIDECERDIVEIAMKKLDVDRDGQITFEDFVNAVKMDPLLLEACGPCLPSAHSAAAFLALMTERYRSYSNIYPGMPLSPIHRKGYKGHSDNNRKTRQGNGISMGISSVMWGMEKSSSSQSTPRASTSSIMNINQPSTENKLRSMSMSVVRMIDAKPFRQARPSLAAAPPMNKAAKDKNISTGKVAMFNPSVRKNTAKEDAFNYRLKLEMSEKDGSHKKTKHEKRMLEIMIAGTCDAAPKKSKRKVIPRDKNKDEDVKSKKKGICTEGKDKNKVGKEGKDKKTVCKEGKDKKTVCKEGKDKKTVCKEGKDKKTVCKEGKDKKTVSKEVKDKKAVCKEGKDKQTVCKEGKDKKKVCQPKPEDQCGNDKLRDTNKKQKGNQDNEKKLNQQKTKKIGKPNSRLYPDPQAA